MNAYEIEKEKLSTRMFHADIELKDLRKHNHEATQMIEYLDKNEHDRGLELVNEKERNEKMQELLHETDAELRKAETTRLFVLQNTNRDLEVKVAKLEQELDLRAKAQEADRKFHKEDKSRMHKQVEKLTEMQRKYHVEIRSNNQAESRYRFKYK
eukprot:CAMPEP_0170451534 /NCGR_PEP_ID=MMETSP0123-20130129/742_1 /TAXON_ID=182087 /ORGANISM="Favella ehrenbergii, Strain Fehren 1" /LENGTH=154 /DNA_ID=CAMNT_0010713255 /DNA_START=368 /DNA_END=832 /DNA_ORIENTATION=-